MTTHHIDLDRSATAAELDRDSLTLARIRNMFPSTAEIKSMAPDGICKSIPGWLPFVDQAKATCVTDTGADTFRRLSDFLSEIKDLGPADTTIDATDRAFFKLTKVSIDLRDEAREPR
jgi:hypothetical protein